MKHVLLLTSLISLNTFGMDTVRKPQMVTVPKKEDLKAKFEDANLTEFAHKAASLIERNSGKDVSYVGLNFGIHIAVSNYLFATNKEYTEAQAKKLKSDVCEIFFQ